MNRFLKIAALATCLTVPFLGGAQTSQPQPKVTVSSDTIVRTVTDEYGQYKKAWEIGVGGTLVNWNRVSLANFRQLEDGSYTYQLKTRHVMGGFNIYLARELNKWFYLDFQYHMTFADKNAGINGTNHSCNYMLMPGIGLQFRFTPLFKSQYIEPYLRVGVNYVHKNFLTADKGVFAGDVTNGAGWNITDTWNPNGVTNDKRNYVPVSFGLGFNAWCSDRFGVGIQGDYVMPFEKKLPHFFQGSIRLMYRIGGRPKKAPKTIEYVEITRNVEVERPVERVVEKVVEKPVVSEKRIVEMLEKVYFEFDKDVITAQSQLMLDDLARIMKEFPEYKFLIIGYTDARGSEAYNLALSKRRAEVVYNDLIKRGISPDRLKWKGVGKNSSLLPASAANEAREGDRKVLIELINNDAYWNSL